MTLGMARWREVRPHCLRILPEAARTAFLPHSQQLPRVEGANCCERSRLSTSRDRCRRPLASTQGAFHHVTTAATSQPLSPLARLAPLWVALGAVGSVILVLFGTMIGALPRPGTTTWWFTLSGINNSLVHIAFYAGVLLVLIGWWGLGAYARQGQLSVAKCWGVLVVWATPLFLGPPLWSRDLYSYVAQGDLAHARQGCHCRW